MTDKPRTGLLGFLADNWLWIVVPLVLAIGAMVALQVLSDGEAQSVFQYDAF